MIKVWKVRSTNIGVGVLKPPEFGFTVELHKDREKLRWEFAISLILPFIFVNWK